MSESPIETIRVQLACGSTCTAAAYALARMGWELTHYGKPPKGMPLRADDLAAYMVLGLLYGGPYRGAAFQPVLSELMEQARVEPPATT